MSTIKIKFTTHQLTIVVNGIKQLLEVKPHSNEQKIYHSILDELFGKLAAKEVVQKKDSKIQMRLHQAIVLHSILKTHPSNNEFIQNEARMLLAQIDKLI